MKEKFGGLSVLQTSWYLPHLYNHYKELLWVSKLNPKCAIDRIINNITQYLRLKFANWDLVGMKCKTEATNKMKKLTKKYDERYLSSAHSGRSLNKKILRILQNVKPIR